MSLPAKPVIPPAPHATAEDAQVILNALAPVAPFFSERELLELVDIEIMFSEAKAAAQARRLLNAHRELQS
jgi:hypothetical protein